MKAIILPKYGHPEEVLQFRKIAKPALKAIEVLVKIYVTAINDYDWSMVRGKPGLYRLLFGLAKPKYLVPGMELSGVVAEIGENVKQFKIGDEVFGDISQYGFGTFAEYIAINENALVLKPDFISFEDSAAIPHASLLAWQALVDLGKIQHGQKVLINGGGGGVGTIGLQIAKSYNCEVTGVDSGEKLEMMRSLGYDQIIDYRKTNFTRNNEKYDLILDCKSNKKLHSYLRVLYPKGKYITVGGELLSLINIALMGKILSMFSKKKLQVLALKPNEGIDHIITLMKEKKITPQIDGPYYLHEIPRLIQYFGEGRHQGKVLIRVDH